MASQTQTEVLNKLERGAKSRRVLAGKCATACTACGGCVKCWTDSQRSTNKIYRSVSLVGFSFQSSDICIHLQTFPAVVGSIWI